MLGVAADACLLETADAFVNWRGESARKLRQMLEGPGCKRTLLHVVKDDIKPMDKTSASILALKPVTFHYKNDANGIPQFGLIAEEVAKVNPDLVARDKNGETYTVRYDAVNAMLLNEFLKEHRKNQQQEATIARLEKSKLKR